LLGLFYRNAQDVSFQANFEIFFFKARSGQLYAVMVFALADVCRRYFGHHAVGKKRVVEMESNTSLKPGISAFLLLFSGLNLTSVIGLSSLNLILMIKIYN